MKKTILSPADRRIAAKRRMAVMQQTRTIHSTSDPIKPAPDGKTVYSFPDAFVGKKPH